MILMGLPMADMWIPKPNAKIVSQASQDISVIYQGSEISQMAQRLVKAMQKPFWMVGSRWFRMSFTASQTLTQPAGATDWLLGVLELRPARLATGMLPARLCHPRSKSQWHPFLDDLQVHHFKKPSKDESQWIKWLSPNMLMLNSPCQAWRVLF